MAWLSTAPWQRAQEKRCSRSVPPVTDLFQVMAGRGIPNFAGYTQNKGILKFLWLLRLRAAGPYLKMTPKLGLVLTGVLTPRGAGKWASPRARALAASEHPSRPIACGNGRLRKSACHTRLSGERRLESYGKPTFS
jgi:hypothetical protein